MPNGATHFRISHTTLRNSAAVAWYDCVMETYAIFTMAALLAVYAVVAAVLAWQ